MKSTAEKKGLYGATNVRQLSGSGSSSICQRDENELATGSQASRMNHLESSSSAAATSAKHTVKKARVDEAVHRSGGGGDGEPDDEVGRGIPLVWDDYDLHTAEEEMGKSKERFERVRNEVAAQGVPSWWMSRERLQSVKEGADAKFGAAPDWRGVPGLGSYRCEQEQEFMMREVERFKKREIPSDVQEAASDLRTRIEEFERSEDPVYLEEAEAFQNSPEFDNMSFHERLQVFRKMTEDSHKRCAEKRGEMPCDPDLEEYLADMETRAIAMARDMWEKHY